MRSAAGLPRLLARTMVILLAGIASLSAVNSNPAIDQARHQFEAGSYSAAITTLRGVTSSSASSAEAYYWLGRCYYELHDYDDAISQAEQSTKLDPKNSVYHMWLGRAYGGKADREHSFSLARKVKKEFEEAVRLNPSNIPARRDLQQFNTDAPWIIGGSKDVARQQVDAIAALDPIEGHLARAEYFKNVTKKIDLSENEYRLVLESKPNRLEPYLEVARFYQNLGHAADMQSAIQAAEKISANDPQLGFYRATSHILAGTELATGEQLLKSYLANTPDRSDWPSHAEAREWLGRLYEGQGKRQEAAEQYRAALQLEPGRKDARERLQKLEKGSH